MLFNTSAETNLGIYIVFKISNFLKIANTTILDKGQKEKYLFKQLHIILLTLGINSLPVMYKSLRYAAWSCLFVNQFRFSH